MFVTCTGRLQVGRLVSTARALGVRGILDVVGVRAIFDTGVWAIKCVGVGVRASGMLLRPPPAGIAVRDGR